MEDRFDASVALGRRRRASARTSSTVYTASKEAIRTWTATSTQHLEF
jgi:hypothetical protein